PALGAAADAIFIVVVALRKVLARRLLALSLMVFAVSVCVSLTPTSALLTAANRWNCVSDTLEFAILLADIPAPVAILAFVNPVIVLFVALIVLPVKVC